MENTRRAGLVDGAVSIITGVAEEIPLEDSSVDAVVGTLVMCSVPDVPLALQEIQRVLKPGGRYLFIEHVAAPAGTMDRFMQDLLTPLQQLLADGCHLNRDTAARIEAAGFDKVDLIRFSVPELSIIGPHIAGIATAPSS